MKIKRNFTKEKRLEIENTVLREAVEEVLADLSDDECNASIRIMSAKFTLAGIDEKIEKTIQRRYKCD